MHYSVLGWNPPGFSESTGNPYPINILNAADAVMQFAFEQGFTEDNIVIFGWSIGGFPGTWLTANYPNIRGLILDASFDHVLPLAYRTMPSFTEDIVKLAIEEYFNLDVATQVFLTL
jgi:pimeloyl-ACP methyl ester carboxylesterase